MSQAVPQSGIAVLTNAEDAQLRAVSRAFDRIFGAPLEGIPCWGGELEPSWRADPTKCWSCGATLTPKQIEGGIDYCGCTHREEC